MPRCDFDVKTTALSCFRCAVYNYFVHICRLVLLTENRPLIWDLAHSDIVHTSRSVLQSLKFISSSQFLLTAAPRTTTLQDNLHFNHCHALLNSKDSFCTLFQNCQTALPFTKRSSQKNKKYVKVIISEHSIRFPDHAAISVLCINNVCHVLENLSRNANLALYVLLKQAEPSLCVVKRVATSTFAFPFPVRRWPLYSCNPA